MAPFRFPGSHGYNQVHLNLGLEGLGLPPIMAEVLQGEAGRYT